MESMATLYKLQAMADGPKLLARTSNAGSNLKIQVQSDINPPGGGVLLKVPRCVPPVRVYFGDLSRFQSGQGYAF